MKIAIPVKGINEIDDHFGHCDKYNVYNVNEKGIILNVHVIASEHDCGCKSNIATVLASEGVKVMLAGGIGSGAVAVLNNAGIDVIRGCSGNAEETVRKYLDGEIQDNGIVCYQHQHHHGGCNH